MWWREGIEGLREGGRNWLTSDTSTSPDNLRAEVSLESGRRPEIVPVQNNHYTHITD